MNKKKVMLSAIVLALVLSIGGVLAYFSDTDAKTNTFTVGKISIQLTEPTWTSTGQAKATNILPNQEVEKDPMITNNGNNPAFVFIEVSIPKKAGNSVLIENQDGTSPNPVPTTDQPLFELINLDGNVGVNSGWTLISTDTTDTNVNKYVYAYGSSSAMSSLAVNGETPKLFNKIRLANVQEGWQVEASTQSVVVTGYGIQTEGLSGVSDPTAAAPATVWGLLKANEVNKP